MITSVDTVISVNLDQFLPIVVFLYFSEIEVFSNIFRLYSKYNIRANEVIHKLSLAFCVNND